MADELKADETAAGPQPVMSRPRPTLPNPYVPLPHDHRWVDALAQGLALLFLLVMFLIWLATPR